jgi:hypothetical protein
MALVLESPYRDSTSMPFRFRRKRFAHVQRLIDDILKERGSCRILDIGGEAVYWEIAKDYIAARNIQITLVNLSAEAVSGPNFTSIQGDATKLDHLADNSFDLVHSNSVIEHVGNWQAMKAMAGHVRRLASRYFVQTPNFWFPIEPHMRAPLFHWLPEQLRYRILMTFDIGFAAKRGSVDHAMRDVQSIALLDRRQFAELFPDAAIEAERVLGLPKSLMAIRP